MPYAVLANSSSSGSSRLSDQVQSILSNVSAAGLDVARVPSPFINFRATTNPRTNDSTLDLVDAGLTGQNVPLEPVLAPARGVDAIVAFDNSACVFRPRAVLRLCTRSAKLTLAGCPSLRDLPATPSTTGCARPPVLLLRPTCPAGA